MSNKIAQKKLTTKIIDQSCFIPILTGSASSDNVNYGVFDNTPLKNTIVEQLYLGIKDPSNGFTFEVNGMSISFLSPNEIMKRNVFNGKMYDVFIIYAGMGWVKAFYYVPLTNMFGFRMDGGSNGYDREENYKEYSSDEFNPSKFEVFDSSIHSKSQIKENIRYPLDELLKILKNTC